MTLARLLDDSSGWKRGALLVFIFAVVPAVGIYLEETRPEYRTRYEVVRITDTEFWVYECQVQPGEHCDPGTYGTTYHASFPSYPDALAEAQSRLAQDDAWRNKTVVWEAER